MKWFPLRTYRRRRREYLQWANGLERLTAAQTTVNQHSFLVKEREGERKKTGKNAASVRANAKKQMAALEQGLLIPFDSSGLDNLLAAWRDLLEGDRQDRAELEVRHAEAADGAARTGVLAYDEAKALGNGLYTLLRKLADARKQNSKAEKLRDLYGELAHVLGRLGRLEHLVHESAEPLKPLEHVTRLPLRQTEETSLRLERMEKLATAVQAARATGTARALRENWTEEQRLFSELRFDSEIWVRRAEQEIRSWLSLPHLHPGMTEAWGQRWQQLLERRHSPSFLAEWDTAKSEITKQVSDLFEEHWAGITSRSRKLRFSADLTWSEVQQVAEQVRRGSMPYVYQAE